MSTSYERRTVEGKGADLLAVEEPLEIRVNGTPFTVTMRTPGSEVELALGFLYTEGITNIRGAKLCTDTPNVVEVELTGAAPPPRNFYTTSSCGVCGKASIDSVKVHSQHDVSQDLTRVSKTVLNGLPAKLSAAQKSFRRTGGTHAVGVFTPDGQLVIAREDVGRHNAMDKVIGTLWQRGQLPLTGHLVLLSGRASFELTQKAWVAGAPIVAAVSAPSTLAVDTAQEAGMTLIGFLRGESMNVYTRPDRIA